VFNEDFYELFSLLEKQKDSRLYIRCHTFITQANRVVIVSSVCNHKDIVQGGLYTYSTPLYTYRSTRRTYATYCTAKTMLCVQHLHFSSSQFNFRILS
jgi:hypothetical protein